MYRGGVKTLSIAVALGAVLVLVPAACKPPQNNTVDAGPMIATTTPEAGPVDPMQCGGCQLAPAGSWSFEGLFRDSTCTDPIAQTVAPACSVVPAIGQQQITYVDDVGLRKAGESVGVTIGEQIGSDAIRYRKSGKSCVKSNEAGIDVTPINCSGQRVCRDAAGVLTCGATCRTFPNGCPDFEETRLYGSIVDPGLKTGKPGGGGGGNLAACCAAITTAAKQLGASPEAGVLLGAAAQCQALAAQAAAGNSPELGALKAALGGRSIPGCNF